MTTIAKIWITFCINRALGIVGPVLMTYGVTVSDNTAELVAGTMITAFQIWLSQRNLKNAIKADPKEKAEDKAGSLAVSVMALSLIPFLSGCAFLAPNYSALPKDATMEQKKAAALADTRAALGSKRNQVVAEILISEAGKYAVSTVKDRVDKEAIKTQLRGRGKAGLDLLEKGEVSPDQMRELFSLSSLTSKLDAEKFSAQFNSAFSPIHDYIDEVSQSDDPKLIRDWFSILCRASIKAGS